MITTTAEALAASLPDSPALDLPGGLTVEDALRIAEAKRSLRDGLTHAQR
ncbi:hypothetical protein [Nocardioides pocheonensis]|nr:hypothetical protein [Nocardioides pocheonensis]